MAADEAGNSLCNILVANLIDKGDVVVLEKSPEERLDKGLFYDVEMLKK